MLVISEHTDERTLLRLFRAGITGYVTRPAEAPSSTTSSTSQPADGGRPGGRPCAVALAARLLDLDRSPAALLG